MAQTYKNKYCARVTNNAIFYSLRIKIIIDCKHENIKVFKTDSHTN